MKGGQTDPPPEKTTLNIHRKTPMLASLFNKVY